MATSKSIPKKSTGVTQATPRANVSTAWSSAGGGQSRSATTAAAVTERPNDDIASGPINRPCNEHKFLTEVADVRQMESGLLRLLDDFHKGKLQVFGRDCTFEQMDHVREQQEKLARLHFDLDGQLQAAGGADEGKELAEKNLSRLLEELEGLGQSIQGLRSGSRAPMSGTSHPTGDSAFSADPPGAAAAHMPKAPPRASRLGKTKSKGQAGEDAVEVAPELIATAKQ